MPRLSKEDVVTIPVLKRRGQSASKIARTLGVTEGTVRYRVKRAEAGAADGRSRQVHVAAGFAREIEAFVAAHARPERPVNLRELYDHLVERHGYPALTDDLKAKIFGLTSARLYGVEPEGACRLDLDDIQLARAELPPPRTYGPETIAQAALHIQAHQGVPFV